MAGHSHSARRLARILPGRMGALPALQPHMRVGSAPVWGHSPLVITACPASIRAAIPEQHPPGETPLPDQCRHGADEMRPEGPPQKRPSRKSKRPNHRTSLNLKETFHLLVSPKQQLHLPLADLTKQPHFFSCTHQKRGKMPVSCFECGKEVPTTSLGSCCSQTRPPVKCKYKLGVCGIAGGGSSIPARSGQRLHGKSCVCNWILGVPAQLFSYTFRTKSQ